MLRQGLKGTVPPSSTSPAILKLWLMWGDRQGLCLKMILIIQGKKELQNGESWGWRTLTVPCVRGQSSLAKSPASAEGREDMEAGHVQLFCDPLDRSPLGSSVHGISQRRIPEWVAISFSRGFSRPRAGTYRQWNVPEWCPSGWELHWPGGTPEQGQRGALGTLGDTGSNRIPSMGSLERSSVICLCLRVSKQSHRWTLTCPHWVDGDDEGRDEVSNHRASGCSLCDLASVSEQGGLLWEGWVSGHRRSQA